MENKEKIFRMLTLILLTMSSIKLIYTLLSNIYILVKIDFNGKLEFVKKTIVKKTISVPVATV